MKKLVKIVILHVWLLVSLYIGIGGYVLLNVEKQVAQAKLLPKDEVAEGTGAATFRNREMYIAVSDEKLAKKFFKPLVENLPKSMLYLVTAMAFGAIGGVTEIVKKIAVDGTSIISIAVYTGPLLGSLIGILTLGVVNLLPDLLMVGKSTVDPISLAFFSLLAGFSSESFFSWLLKVISGKIYNR